MAPVAKRLGDATVRMLAYNGSIPGPTLKVRQGSEIIVHVTNDGDLDTTVHWHGLRLENRYDGVPHETQQPIPVGGELHLPARSSPTRACTGTTRTSARTTPRRWASTATSWSRPADPDYWPPAHRDVVLTLDDVLIEDGMIAPFSRSETTHAAMGRFGNVLLIGGETDLALTARAGEVVRLWLTNTANTRVFNVRLPGARMKLVGGDSGRVEHEEFVDEVLLAPSERAVVDVLFDQPGQLRSSTARPTAPTRWPPSPSTDEPAEPSLRDAFEVLRSAPELAAERRAARRLAGRPAGQDPRRGRRDGRPRRPVPTGHRWPTPARCTPRSPATSRAAARSAA